MDEKIIEMYSDDGLTMREIARRLGTNHRMIGHILKRNGISTRSPKNLRGKRKFPCDTDLKYNNMVTHLKWDVSIEWARQFRNFEMLKFLNKAVTNRDNRYPLSTEEYKAYVEKFYRDYQFNALYFKWINNKKDKYLKPSLDHKIPKSKGGTNDLRNLQFLTWFENRCKNDMSQVEWDNMKKNIQEYLI